MPFPIRRLAAASWLALVCPTAHADEWVINPAVDARLSYNDNINMAVNNPLTVTELSLSPSAKFSNSTESHDLAIEAGVSANRFPGHSEYNAVNHQFDLAAKWLGELNQFSFDASSLRDSTLDSELQSTAYVSVRRQRTQNRISSAWRRALDETTFASFGVNIARVRYEAGSTLADFNDNVANLSLREQVSPTFALTGAYSWHEYKTLDNYSSPYSMIAGWDGLYEVEEVVRFGNTRTRVGTASLGGQWRWSERLVLDLEAGRFLYRNNQEQIAGQCYWLLGAQLTGCTNPVTGINRLESTGSSYTASSDYQMERGAFGFSWSRSLTPSGTGNLLRTDSGTLNFSHRPDDTQTLGLSGMYTRSREVGDVGNVNARLASCSLSYTRRLDEWLQLSLGYTFARQQAIGQGEAARVNVVFANLKWDIAPLSRSR